MAGGTVCAVGSTKRERALALAADRSSTRAHARNVRARQDNDAIRPFTMHWLLARYPRLMFILRDNYHNALYLNLMILVSCMHVIGLAILFAYDFVQRL
jgi:hypothetical protein